MALLLLILKHGKEENASENMAPMVVATPKSDQGPAKVTAALMMHKDLNMEAQMDSDGWTVVQPSKKGPKGILQEQDPSYSNSMANHKEEDRKKV